MQSIVLRRAISTAVAIFIAVIADFYLSSLRAFWVPIVTLLIMQTTVKTNLRLALQRFAIIGITVACISGIMLLKPPLLGLLLLSLVVAALFLHGFDRLHTVSLTPALIVGVIALMFWMNLPKPPFFYAHMSDVALGGVIGLLAGIIILPGRPDVDFRQGVIPLLQAYSQYLFAIGQVFLGEANDADKAKYQVEKTLQTEEAHFPAWVYVPGFNVALRQGHRHFLVRLEQIAGVLFAMHHIARETKDLEVINHLREAIIDSITKTQDIIAMLVSLLKLERAPLLSAEYGQDIVNLEKAFQVAVPLPIELLDMSVEYIHAAAFVYDLKDCQQLLLKLVEALPPQT